MPFLDVRGLPPCEPLERVLAALDDLPAGETLEVLIHREPVPLYALLGERGFAWRAERAGEAFRILIARG